LFPSDIEKKKELKLQYLENSQPIQIYKKKRKKKRGSIFGREH
jgi:hypothetical protein